MAWQVVHCVSDQVLVIATFNLFSLYDAFYFPRNLNILIFIRVSPVEQKDIDSSGFVRFVVRCAYLLTEILADLFLYGLRPCDYYLYGTCSCVLWGD